MSYLPITLNHFRAIKSWAEMHDAQVTLNARSFDLEVKARNRFYVLRPRFIMVVEGKMAYTTELVQDATGFIGWLPYDVLSWDISQNKLLAKKFFRSAGIHVPNAWESLSQVDDHFVLKTSAGSFGYQVMGPYRYQDKTSAQVGDSVKPGRGISFAEQFVCGTNLKVWYWGQRAIYAQLHPYPRIVGDGISSIESLIEARLSTAGITSTTSDVKKNFDVSLAFQKIAPAEVLAQEREAWIDFRHGRRYLPFQAQSETDCDLSRIEAPIRDQINSVGIKVGQEGLRLFKAPTLYSVDVVIDSNGLIWWLEINSNPMLPPDGYQHIFSWLFGLGSRLPS